MSAVRPYRFHCYGCRQVSVLRLREDEPMVRKGSGCFTCRKCHRYHRHAILKRRVVSSRAVQA